MVAWLCPEHTAVGVPHHGFSQDQWVCAAVFAWLIDRTEHTPEAALVEVHTLFLRQLSEGPPEATCGREGCVSGDLKGLPLQGIARQASREVRDQLHDSNGDVYVEW